MYSKCTYASNMTDKLYSWTAHSYPPVASLPEPMYYTTFKWNILHLTLPPNQYHLGDQAKNGPLLHPLLITLCWSDSLYPHVLIHTEIWLNVSECWHIRWDMIWNAPSLTSIMRCHVLFATIMCRKKTKKKPQKNPGNNYFLQHVQYIMTTALIYMYTSQLSKMWMNHQSPMYVELPLGSRLHRNHVSDLSYYMIVLTHLLI